MAPRICCEPNSSQCKGRRSAKALETKFLLVVFALSNWNGPIETHLAVGSLLYIIGCFLVTMVFNVPLNKALARTDANNPDSVSLWRHYLHRWTFWNHVRTGASLAPSDTLKH